MKKQVLKLSLLLLVFLFVFSYFFQGTYFNLYQNKASIFSYDVAFPDLTDYETFYTMAEELEIGAIYQLFSKEYLESRDNSFLKEMKEQNIIVYALINNVETLFDEGVSLKEKVDEIISYNEEVEETISGVVFSFKPYLDVDFTSEMMEAYVKSMKNAYTYASTHHLKVSIVIPYWFDSVNDSLLYSLIRNACDEVAIMNFNIEKTKENIASEIDYARKMSKDVKSIVEVSFGKEGYFASFAEIRKDYEDCKDYYGYAHFNLLYEDYDAMKVYFENIGKESRE